MSWSLVARKDFEDSVRSRMIWGVIGIFAALMILLGVASSSDGAIGAPEDMLIMFTNLGGQVLVPLVALAVGYRAIVQERQSGSLRVLFGLSHGRRDVFVGKLVSRLGVISIATFVACLIAIVLAAILFDSIPVWTFFGFVGITVLFGAAFTSIGLAISAVVDSRMKATAGLIGTYFFFSMFWYPMVAGIHYLIEGDLAGHEAPHWYFFLLRMSPLEAYIQTMSSLTDQLIWHAIGWQNVVENIEEGTSSDLLLLENRVGGDLPFYFTDWFAGVIMLFWIVVPGAIAYWRFSRVDLN